MIGSITLRAPDLLAIGDGVSIGNAVNLENARVEHGELLLGAIALGNDACVGSYAVLEGNTAIGALGHLEGQIALSDGMARAGRAHLERLAGARRRRLRSGLPAGAPAVSRTRQAGEALFFVFGALLIATLFFLPVFPELHADRLARRVRDAARGCRADAHRRSSWPGISCWPSRPRRC